ncbi:MAG: chemotaxis protein CheA [Terracidiphilus sp.]|jgi:two-component system chemotaxis sensor kinase CheA
MKIDLSQFRQTFLQESVDHIASMETGLLQLRTVPDDVELLNSIFRSAHSIKGGAGSFGMTTLVRFTHSLENLLDRMRSLEIQASDEVIDILLQSVDVLRNLLDTDPNANSDAAMPSDAVELDARIVALIPVEAAPAEGASKDAQRHVSFQQEPPKPVEEAHEVKLYKVEFRPDREMFSSGTNPIVLLRNLAALGTVSCCHLHSEELPALADLDPSLCYLSWTVELASVCAETELREVFEFVEHLAEIRIHCTAAAEQPGATPSQDSTVAPNLVSSVASGDLSVLVDRRKAPVVDRRQSSTRSATGGESSSIRVAIDKVDRLIDLVGELVIAHVMTAQMVEDFEPSCLPKLRENVAAMERNTRELHERVMGIRMLPIGTLFQRYTRTVYDIAQATGKEIRLEMSGEETEIDKSMLELLGDPLTHLIRNAADHGIEAPAARLAAGKPEEGVLKLKAFHRSGRIVIEGSDDGAGIDPEVVRRKAIERGLIGADVQMSNEQLLLLIFEPGFSTQEQVSDLSGRGVGMDVVKRNVQQMNGTVSLESEKGRGTTVTIELPLTLAILEGLLVRVGTRTLVLPLLSVIETVPLRDQQIVRVAERGEVVVIREESIPLLRLSRFLGLTLEISGSNKTAEVNNHRRLAVIVEAGRRKVGLVVDELLGQQQVVVKSLERNLRRIDGLMGATILGDGCVAPIVDVTGLGALDLFSLQVPVKHSQQVVPPAQSVRAASSIERERGGTAHELV